MEGDLDEAERLAGMADEVARGPGARAVVAEVLGDLASARGDLTASVLAYDELRRIGRSASQPAWEGYGAACTALALVYADRAEEARRMLADALTLSIRGRSGLAEALSRYVEGELLSEQQPEAALAAFGTTVRLARRARATMLEGIARTSDVALRGRAGDPLEALLRYREALGLWREAGAGGLLATSMRNLVVLLARCGADEEALRLFAVLSRLGASDSNGAERVRLDRAVSAARARHGADPPADEVADLLAAADLATTLVDRAVDLLPDAAPPPTVRSSG